MNEHLNDYKEYVDDTDGMVKVRSSRRPDCFRLHAHNLRNQKIIEQLLTDLGATLVVVYPWEVFLELDGELYDQYEESEIEALLWKIGLEEVVAARQRDLVRSTMDAIKNTRRLLPMQKLDWPQVNSRSKCETKRQQAREWALKERRRLAKAGTPNLSTMQ